MLLELRIKDLVFTGKADVEFGGGLNILTGKTGVGKSTIIGFVTIALGGKALRGSIRPGVDYAYIELVLSVIGEEKQKALRELEVEPTGDGLVIISRELASGRGINRINDEIVTMARLSQITSLLLDIHRQHEYQSLLYKSRHFETLGVYVKAATQPVKQTIADRYRIYRSLEKKLRGFDLNVGSCIREADFLQFKIEEIEAPSLKEGEEEELTPIYRHYSHSRRIVECLGVACETVEGEWFSRALKEAEQATEYDETLGDIRDQLYDTNSILRDAKREMSTYLGSMEMDEEIFRKTEGRLGLIHNLQAKYGATVEAIRQKLKQGKKRLEELEDHDAHRKRMEQELEECRNDLEKLCVQLAGIHKEASRPPVRKIRQGLVDLNLLDVELDMELEKPDHPAPSGWDGVQFLISTNPRQSMRSLKDVASGGEPSRTMLAIKIVLADSDDIPILIFDEVDTGISGRTTREVSEKLILTVRSHQIICITHLPQVATMVNSHFGIAKSASQGRTITTIRLLDRKAPVEELARLLGNARITEVVFKNIGGVKESADKARWNRLKS